jgi:type VI secretion system secreted protein VgrG
MPLVQKARIAIVDTPLGADVVVLNRVVISEQLSQPFRIEADLLSEKGELRFEDIIGKGITITMMTNKDVPRYFHGIVSRFSQMGQESRYDAYRMEVVPKFWTLTRTYQSRIFQNLDARAILQKVLAGFDLDWALTGSFPVREYCVQYRETDFNFASRIMEEEGIYYFFKHVKGKHTMVLANNRGAHLPLLPDYQKIAFRPYTGRPTGSEFIHDWVHDKLLLPATYTHTDYDFESPKKNLLTRAQKPREHALGTGEWSDFPGLHTKPADGERRASVRAEEIHSRYEMAKGKADARGIQTGFVFTMIDHPRPDQNGKHLVTSAVHTLLLDAYESGDTDRGAPYHCAFTTIPANTQFRPQRVAPKPFVQGPQTAIVVGPPGEEIFTDKYARVKVQFHWDRDGRRDQNSSCWVRVSQIWAGKGWGGMSIPRIGQEVIVDFLEGDPDQPIIIGRVYNGEQMPPYALPAKKVVSGVKTNSTPGGGGYNEMSMDDTKGTEKITIHGQFDLDSTVEHDQKETIGNNRTETVGMDHVEKIGRNRALTVAGGENITVEKSRSDTINENEAVTIGKSRSTLVGDNDNLTVGKTLKVLAGDEIQLVCGLSSITLKKDGTIDIKGKDISVVGVGTTAIKGLMVNIN